MATTPNRSRRSSLRAPFDFSLPMPPASATYARSHASSRPQSASFFRAALVEVHSALYSRGDREEVADCLQRCYEVDAVFENPFVIITGRAAIANHFSLMTLIPGEVYDELGEISESEDYDGCRSILFSHTMHLALVPGVGPAPITYSRSYASFPTTPYETPYDVSPENSPGSSLRSLMPRFRVGGAGGAPAQNGTGPDVPAWPIAQFLSYLKPSVLISNLTTVHLRVITTLKFNEAGRIVHHEDTWGLKEVVEGFIPIAGRLYWLPRKAFGTAASGLARALGVGMPAVPAPADAEHNGGEVSSATYTKSTAAGLGLMDGHDVRPLQT